MITGTEAVILVLIIGGKPIEFTMEGEVACKKGLYQAVVKEKIVKTGFCINKYGRVITNKTY